MAKLRIPRISLLDWLAKGESVGASDIESEREPARDPDHKATTENARVTQDIKVVQNLKAGQKAKREEAKPILADSLDLYGDTLMVEHWNCIPELTAPTEEPPEVVPSLTVKDKPKSGKNKDKKPKGAAKLASQVDTKPPEQSHPFANFSVESLQVIASNPRTPTSTLCWLATHFNPDVRCTVARNISVLPETIWLLAKDYDEAVRLAVAEHQQDYENVLKSLSSDESPLVAWHAKKSQALLENRRTEHSEQLSTSSRIIRQTADVIAVMQEHLPIRFRDSVHDIEFLKLIASKTTTPGYRLATLAKHPNHEIRGLVAENTNAPREVFWLLAKDDVVEVKAKLADNYNCPMEVLEYLQDDQDSYVAWQSKNIISKLLGKEVPTLFEEDTSLSTQRLLHTQ